MTIVDRHTRTDQEDKPLTRIDVEKLLREAGSSEKLNLNGFNLKEIDLSGFVLKGANLSLTDLRKADLQNADLSGADLRGADLRGAILHNATLFKTDLSWANLENANLYSANLSSAYLICTNLTDANLPLANLSRAILFGANLTEANLDQATLRNIHLHERDKERLRNQRYPIPDEENAKALDQTLIISIRIIEEPLTAQNLNTIISAITDLHTCCWLIQQKLFSDLIDYSQTRDPRFIREANLRVGTMSHSSPALIDFLVSAGGIAGGAATLALALKIGIDAIAQIPLRFEATKLKNLKEKQEQEIREKQAQLDLKIAAQKAESENKDKQQEQQLAAQRAQLDLERQQMLLEIEKQKLGVEAEKQRTVLERERLELEKNRVIIVQEIAVTMVSQLLTNEDRGDEGRNEMLVNSLIPSLLQLAASDAVVTTVSVTPPNEENKGSTGQK